MLPVYLYRYSVMSSTSGVMTNYNISNTEYLRRSQCRASLATTVICPVLGSETGVALAHPSPPSSGTVADRDRHCSPRREEGS